MGFKIEVNTKAITKKIDKMTDDIQKGIERGLLKVASETAQVEQKFIEITTGGGSYVPTGRLKGSVTIMPIEWSPYGASITIKPTVDYATYVNEGTGEHHPQGRQGGWYYTPDEGNTFFFTWGIRPHYFVDKTYDYMRDKVGKIIQEEIYKCLR